MYVLTLPEDDGLYRTWYERMPEMRQKKASRYKAVPVRRRCIAAYALLEYAMRELMADVGIDYREDVLPVFEDDRGKPYFTGIPVYFNISHSGDRVAVAVSDSEVGCDVERKNGRVLQIAKRFFTEEEFAYLSGMDNDDVRRLEFTRLWTLKESVVKCSGEGLGRAFSDFSLVDEKGTRVRAVTLPQLEGRFYTREYEPEEGYCFSICSRSGDMEDKIRHVRLYDEQKGIGIF